MRNSHSPLRRSSLWCARRPPAATKYRACRTRCSANCSRWFARTPTAPPPAFPRLGWNGKFQRFSSVYSIGGVLQRVFESRVLKALEAQPARIAQTTGAAVRIRIVATVGHSEVDAQPRAQLYDLRFGKLHQ